MTDTELKPCPFCGSSPDFPKAKYVFGTCYCAGCDECGIATVSIQIIDCFDYPRGDVHNSWDENTKQYGIHYILVARAVAVEKWNNRITEI